MTLTHLRTIEVKIFLWILLSLFLQNYVLDAHFVSGIVLRAGRQRGEQDKFSDIMKFVFMDKEGQ